MVSQITPPSSSPNRSDHVQPNKPNKAGPFERQQHDRLGSSVPPPKRQRKASPVVGESVVISLLSDHLEPGPNNGLPGLPQHSDPAPTLHSAGPPARPSPVKPRPSGSSRSRPRPSNPAKALAKAAANGSIETAPPVDPRAQEVACEPTTAASHDRHQNAWAVPPPINQAPDRPQSWAPRLSETLASPPFQPAWDTQVLSSTFHPEQGHWMGSSNVDLTPTNPFFRQYYPGANSFLQPQEQSWSPAPLGYAYDLSDLSAQTNVVIDYPYRAQQMPSGTVDQPILLDDGPVQAVQAPHFQTSQFFADGTHSFMAGNKENTTPFQSIAHPPTAYQPPVAQEYSTMASEKPTRGINSESEPKPRSTRDEPELCPEQAELVSLIEQGKNVFYTGSAGCGKSTVLKAFVRRLRDSGKKVRIIAPTGRAALNVGGSTTWTFAGWTPNSHKLPIETIMQGAHGKNVFRRLKKTDVLVIDEISMVENLHFERLNILMKAARHNPNLAAQPAFGGCQIVVTGDFCQLPPVKPFQHCLTCGREMTGKVGDNGIFYHVCRLHGEYADEDKWAFRSSAWKQCDFVHFHLKTIHRQNDQKFIRMLQKCRLGHKLRESEISLLMDHKCRVSQATKLYSTRREANDVNRIAFNQLKGVNYVYWCHDSFFWRECHPQLQWKGVSGDWGDGSEIASPPETKRPIHALEDHRWAKCVQLKRGMLVVLLTNLDLEAGLCNGSQGVICSFEDYDPKKLPMVDKVNARGKRQVEPQPGQRLLRGEHASVQESEIKKFIKSESAPVKKWPVVQFHNGARRTVYAECSIASLGDEEPHSLLARTQIPLAPAWAMTIHKSQSLTLDRVIVNLSRAFEDGQVYVALSRATGLSGLKIEGDGDFLRTKLMVNAEVAAFLRDKFGDIYDAAESEDDEVPPG